MNEYISVEEARKRMLESITVMDWENVPLIDSSGRILFNDIISSVDIPPFNNSAMDGYAVRCVDVAEAASDHHVAIPVIDEIKAGDNPQWALKEKTAIRIMTGAPIPANCDAVIPVEYTDEQDGVVRIYRAVKLHENIRCSGEDISIGQKVLRKGDRIRSADAGLLASLNIGEVPVYKQPRVAIISTGDEIVDVGESMPAGKIRNSNSYTLYSEVKKYNALPSYLGVVRDDPAETKKKLEEAFQFDIVLTTGGVSMGKYDYVKDALLDSNVVLKTVKIRMKPGKPLIFGVKGSTLFFGLPGNPVSTLITFIMFVRPVILRMMGATSVDKPIVMAYLSVNLMLKTDRTHFIRGFYTISGDRFYVNTTGPQGSGILRSMSEANCLIIIPEGAGRIECGDMVSIMLINHEEI